MEVARELATSVCRQRIVVAGIVQGVGFRPFVYGLATSLGLDGFVRNDGDGVTIEAEGAPEQLEAFIYALRSQPPPLARIDDCNVHALELRRAGGFHIVSSEAGTSHNTLVSPDVATCPDCLHELLNPQDRRYNYPFTNCTNCGPRFTIIQDVPYDRPLTTMRHFEMCADCLREYEDPLDRRFHAQPNACPQCGPHITLHLSQPHPRPTAILALRCSAELLAAGKVIAVKGLGGYHLACNALDGEAVQRLRREKQRPFKPLALMVPDVETARAICLVEEGEAALLSSRRRPIVLLQRRPGSLVAHAVAPGQQTLGLMLPYTPLHHLLLQAMQEALGDASPVALVMTSGNPSHEPIVYRDGDAFERLTPLVDGILTNNRPIEMRCDDSVTRVVAGGEQLLRRARGYVPEPLLMARPFAQPLLACGGHLKNTFCLAKKEQVFISQHIGDLDNVETLLSYREAIEHFQKLFDIRPRVVAYDLHPDYLSTKYALDLPLEQKIGVQHHHAHIASVLAEAGIDGPVIGVAADGSGYGPDGAVWGGEIMVADLKSFRRLGHLAYAPLPGGEQAVRQPWRMAAAYLQMAYGQKGGEDEFLELDIPFVQQLDRTRWQLLRQMIVRGLNTPPTSSLGRLFDAVSALLGICRQSATYEGQAAVELEAVAVAGAESYPFALLESSGQDSAAWQMDPTPALRALVADIQRGVAACTIAGRFHETVAQMLAAAVRRAVRETGLKQVALSGGVFQNRLLLERLLHLLREDGLEALVNRHVPPNDGGLSLGQAAVAGALSAEW